MTPKEIAFAFLNGGRFPRPLPRKIFGRILRGTTQKDFTTMTPDFDRRTVIAYGCDGIQHLYGRSGYEMLIEVGYAPEEITRLVGEYTIFRFLIFQEDTAIVPATWGNVLRIAQQAYPLARKQFKIQHVRLLESLKIKVMEQEYGIAFSDAARRGPTHKLFMTEQRLAKCKGLAREIRAFLWHTMGLREQFTGEGHTQTDGGDEGVSEFIMLNRPIVELDHVLLNLSVELPVEASTP